MGVGLAKDCRSPHSGSSGSHPAVSDRWPLRCRPARVDFAGVVWRLQWVLAQREQQGRAGAPRCAACVVPLWVGGWKAYFEERLAVRRWVLQPVRRSVSKGLLWEAAPQGRVRVCERQPFFVAPRLVIPGPHRSYLSFAFY